MQLTNYKYSGWHRDFSKRWCGEREARDEADLRKRLDAEGIELKWCAPMPEKLGMRIPWRTIALAGTAVSLLPLVISGVLLWYVPTLFGVLAATRESDLA